MWVKSTGLNHTAIEVVQAEGKTRAILVIQLPERDREVFLDAYPACGVKVAFYKARKEMAGEIREKDAEATEVWKAYTALLDAELPEISDRISDEEDGTSLADLGIKVIA